MLKRVWIRSPNYSSRGGSGVRLVVIHTAEGARSFRDLGNFFASSSAGVSSHVGIDDERGTIGEYVHRPDKAWTQANANPYSVSVELCAAPKNSSHPCGANWTAEEWNRHDGMLANVADWIREECQTYGLPIVKLSASAAQSGGRGVCGHVDLGASGGGHWDPGPNFPWQRVMDMAKQGTSTPPTPVPPPVTQPPPVPTPVVLLPGEGDFVVLNFDGRVEAFTTATDTIAHRWQTKPGQAFNHSWSSFSTLAKGTEMTSVVANKDGRLELFTVTSDNEVLHRWQVSKGGTWNDGWSSLGRPGGGKQNGSYISAIANHDGRLEVFVETADGAMFHRWQTKPGQTFVPEWSGMGTP